MKQKAENLLKGTVVKNNSEFGRLIRLEWDKNGKLYWLINWSNRGLEFVRINIVQSYELA